MTDRGRAIPNVLLVLVSFLRHSTLRVPFQAGSLTSRILMAGLEGLKIALGKAAQSGFCCNLASIEVFCSRGGPVLIVSSLQSLHAWHPKVRAFGLALTE